MVVWNIFLWVTEGCEEPGEEVVVQTVGHHPRQELNIQGVQDIDISLIIIEYRLRL